jgi:hypothetical protein
MAVSLATPEDWRVVGEIERRIGRKFAPEASGSAGNSRLNRTVPVASAAEGGRNRVAVLRGGRPASELIASARRPRGRTGPSAYESALAGRTVARSVVRDNPTRRSETGRAATRTARSISRQEAPARVVSAPAHPEVTGHLLTRQFSSIQTAVKKVGLFRRVIAQLTT